MVLRIKPEKKEEKERVGLALLRATLRLAATHGFASLGLREVAREAGIAPTSFYRHFADMEELGLALIESLVGPFVRGWVERAAGAGVAAIAYEALAGSVEEPELMRFIVTERVGTVPAFRAAFSRELGVVVAAFQEYIVKSLAPERVELSEKVADAATVIVLEACARALDDPAPGSPALRELVVFQVQTLLRGAVAGGIET